MNETGSRHIPHPQSSIGCICVTHESESARWAHNHETAGKNVKRPIDLKGQIHSIISNVPRDLYIWGGKNLWETDRQADKHTDNSAQPNLKSLYYQVLSHYKVWNKHILHICREILYRVRSPRRKTHMVWVSSSSKETHMMSPVSDYGDPKGLWAPGLIQSYIVKRPLCTRVASTDMTVGIWVIGMMIINFDRHELHFDLPREIQKDRQQIQLWRTPYRAACRG